MIDPAPRDTVSLLGFARPSRAAGPELKMTYHRACEAALRSCFRILERIEERPWEAVTLARLRNLVAVRRDPEEGGVIQPIQPTTPCSVLLTPHPLRNKPDGFVGEFSLYEVYGGQAQPVEGLAVLKIRRDGSVYFENEGPVLVT